MTSWLIPRRVPIFVGRQAELKRILRELERQNLVLIEGPRGIGKTSLALEVAHQLQDRPVLWLSQPPSLESLMHTVSQALPEAFEPGWLQAQGPREDKLLLLVQGLDAHRVVLVVDGAEACPDLPELLRLGQRFLSLGALVLTSQTRVRLSSAERADALVVRLQGLTEEESRSLLRQQLGEDGDWNTLVELSRGHPLVLKLCAGLVREHRISPETQTPQALLEELAAELKLSLNESEQEAMQLLAVAQGPLPGEALKPEVLQELDERFLLERSDTAVAISDLLAQTLRRGLIKEVVRKHHSRCAELLEESDDEDDMLRAIEHRLEAGQTVRAAELLQDRKKRLYQVGRFEELVRFFRRIGPGDPGLDISHADCLASLGRLEEGLEVLELVERKADPQLRLKSLNSRCHMLLDLGRFDEAEVVGKEALELAESLPGRQPGRVKALNGLGRVQVLRAQGKAGQLTAESAIAAAREMGDLKGVAYAGFVRARALGQQDLWSECLHQCHRSLDLAREIQEIRLAFLVRFLAGEALLKLGRLEEAGAWLDETWSDGRRFPDIQLRAMAELMQAKQLRAQDRDDQAQVHLRAADELAEKLQNPALALQVLLLKDQPGEASALARDVGLRQMEMEVARQAPYRAVTAEGERALSPADYAALQEQEMDYDLWLDLPAKKAVERSRGPLNLLSRRILMKMLLALVREKGNPLSQEELFARVWEYEFEGESSAAQVRKNVSVLRDMLEPDRANPTYIRQGEHAFQRKGGYYFNPEACFCLIEEC